MKPSKKVIVFIVFLFTAKLYATEYFQQEVNYTINVKLDDVKHELTADETIEYINNSPHELTYIYFHLWPNAYKNNQTALAKQLLENGDTKFYYAEENDRGYIDGLDFKVNGQAVKWEYDKEHIDICKITLNEPLSPGAKVIITTPFHVKIPKGIFSRLGHINQAYQITQWYPKPAVFDKNGWHQMPYLTQGEFYSEFGAFDVSITLPKNYVIGATGDLVNGESELEWLNHKVKQTEKITQFTSDNSYPVSDTEYKTLRYKQEKVHDFAWFADKRFHVLKGEVELPHSKRKVTTWAMFTNSEPDIWKNSVQYINDAIYYYSLWNGDYPYNHMTAVDGALSAGGGMEYPNVTVIGPSRTAFLLETVIMHEVGHNWFYGILGSNEREHPWMDEGINSFNENRYIRTKYPETGVMGMGSDSKLSKVFDLGHLKHKSQYELGYVLTARKNTDQPMELPANEYTEMNYGTIVYFKSAIVFDYLYYYLGEELFDKCMQAYFEKWKFKHPQPEDIKAVFVNVTGKNLDWFFDKIIPSTAKIDYKISGTETTGNTIRVYIKNKGDLAVPFTVSAIKDGKIILDSYSEGFYEKSYVEFPAVQYDMLVIDYRGYLPDVNRKNNNLKSHALFKKIEPLKLQLLGSVENPNKTQIFYTPVLGWNSYDKWMAGVSLYNVTVPQRKFEYVLTPMYSFVNRELVGNSSLNYHILPKKGKVYELKPGINASRYHYLNTSEGKRAFTRIAPELSIEFRKKQARSALSNIIQIRSVYVEEERFRSTISTLYNEVSYLFNNKKTINPWGLEFSFQQSADFLRTTLETNHRFEYSKLRKGLDVRIFAGKYLVNNTNNGRYNFRMDGVSGIYDYMYDNIFLGRTEYTGLLSQQFIAKQGGFKTPTPVGQSFNWLASVNLKAEFPLPLPIGAFADAGTNHYGDILYDGGLYFWLGKGVFEVYFPLFYSDNIQAAFDANGKKYTEKIRFTLNLNKLNPFEIVRKLEF